MVVAGVSLLLFLPLLVLIAIAVKLSSPGPALYVQERVGRDRPRGAAGRPVLMARRHAGDRRGLDTGGKLFKMYKFRTMYVAREETGQVWSQKNDPRITPVGRILRSSRLDESPQLWNVLLGHMSVVGPRPEQPEIFRRIRSAMVGYSQRQRVLPGITGWAQIKQRIGPDIQRRETQARLRPGVPGAEVRSRRPEDHGPDRSRGPGPEGLLSSWTGVAT